MWPKKRQKPASSTAESSTRSGSDKQARWRLTDSVSSSDRTVDGDDSDPGADAPVITVNMVRERAVNLLARREHGKKELLQKLLLRELPQDLVTSVVDKLQEEGLQSDARFAESYTRMRVGRGYGANKVRADLQTRHIEQSVIDRAVRETDIDWGSVASGALDKKFAGKLTELDAEAISKMQRYLYGRGFEMAEIKSAIKEFDLPEMQQNP